MKARVAVIALATLVLSPRVARAQVTDNRDSPSFLEQQYFFTRLPLEQLVFEGQYAPHLYFYQGLFEKGAEMYRHPVWTWSVAFTPMLRLRMLKTFSSPVAPPSYMPRPLLDWQIFRASVAMNRDSHFTESPVRLWGLTVIPWAHHSNGQTGCLFRDQHPIVNAVGDTTSCGNPATIPNPRTVNRNNGSFSTNLFAVALNYRSIRTRAARTGVNETDKSCTYSLQLDVHPVGYFPGGIDADQAAIYPTQQVHFVYDLSRHAGEARYGAAMRVDYLNRTAVSVPHWVYQPEVSYLPAWLRGWGAFARYFDGMDYYNFNFVDHKRWLQIGFVHSAARAEQFGLPRGGPIDGSYPPARSLDKIARPLDAFCKWMSR